MKRIILLLALYILLLNSPQAIEFNRIGVEQGLANSVVFDISEDNQGYLWFTTYNGLSRYDGYQFKTFRHDENDPNSLAENDNRNLHLDQLGQLWIGSRSKGLQLYQAKTQQFIHYRFETDNINSLSNNHIEDIKEDQQGFLWVASQYGLNRINIKDKTIKRFYVDNSPAGTTSGNYILALFIEADYIWAGTRKGIKRFNRNTEQFESFTASEQSVEPHLSLKKSVHSIIKENDTLWIGTYQGLFKATETQPLKLTITRFTPEQPITVNNPINSKPITVQFKDNAGAHWIAPYSHGIYRRIGNKLERFMPSLADSKSLSDNIILGINQDSQDSIWIGTVQGGVSVIHQRPNQFGHHYHNPLIPASLSNKTVLALYKDSQDTLWVGTRDGLNQQTEQGFKHFRHDPEVDSTISNNQINRIIEDNQNRLWFGSSYSGLNLFDRQTETFRRFQKDPNATNTLRRNNIASILQHSNGIMWVGTTSGVSLLNPQNLTFDNPKQQSPALQSLANHSIRQMLEGPKGQVWLATDKGLVEIHPDGKFIRFIHDAENPANSLKHNNVLSLLLDGQYLWLGGVAGLSRFNWQQQTFKHFNEQDGLGDDNIVGMEKDADNHLWLSSTDGLIRFNSKTHSVKNFNRQDGIQHSDFTEARFKAKDGELFFGGINGFNRFYPQHITVNKTPPKVVLTQLLLANQPVELKQSNRLDKEVFTIEKPIDELDKLTLTHKQNLITFEFSALHFINPNSNQFAYRLIGQDQQWIYTDANNRRATYTNLAPGDYQLQIKASNNDNYWSEKHKTLDITVLPPWWRSPFAYLVYVIAFISALYGIFYYRTRRLMQRAKWLEQKVSERTETIAQLMAQKDRMFTNISHEFKTPLTLILNPMESISPDDSKQTIIDKIAMIKRNAQRLLRMVEQLLELSKIESQSGTQQWHYYSFNQSLNILVTSFEPLLEIKQLNLKVQTAQDVTLKLKTDSLETILTNLLSNAIKYTPEGGQITISTTVAQGKINIAIEDTGIGIDAQNQQLIFNRFTRATDNHSENIPGAGIGLALVKELVEANNGAITLQSTLTQGSTFTIILPIAKRQSSPITQIEQLNSSSQLELKSLSASSANLSQSTSQHISDNDETKTSNNANQKQQILIIDDNADMLQLLTDTLAPSFDCTTAIEGDYGLVQAQEQLPDLIISDIMMPGLSGFDVLQQLKSNPLTCHIPVILLTAKGDSQSRIQGWESQADEYLEKPFHGPELIARIDNILSIRTLLAQRFQQQFAQQLSEQVAQTQSGKKSKQQLEKNAQQFSHQLEQVLAKHYQDEKLSVVILAEEMAVSQRQLTRKVKSVLGMTVVESIRAYRLKKAAQLLAQGMAPSIIALEVGFSSHSYFASCFKAQYGSTPSDYNPTDHH